MDVKAQPGHTGDTTAVKLSMGFSFAGHGKKTALAVWTVFPELTNALLKVSSAPDNIRHYSYKGEVCYTAI